MIQKIPANNFIDVLALVAEFPPQLGFRWKAEDLRLELEQSQAWGHWLDSELCAFVAFRDQSAAYEITVLGTALKKRGQGCMKKLLEHIFAAMHNKPWWLEVHEANDSALQLYKSLNFLVTGRRPAYYQDGGAALLLSREPVADPSVR